MSTVSKYAFLSKPPQLKQKKRKPVPPVNVPVPLTVAIAVNEPSPTAARSFSSITVWAQAVQPGSPAPRTPPSPYRTLRRASVSSLCRARRGSLAHARASDGSFLHLIDTPTTSSAKDTTFDLTNLGYTSVFVPSPKTPVTPKTPKTPSKSKLSLKRIRSLGVLRPLRSGRPRSRSTSSSNPPPSPKVKAKAKKAKAKAPLPPTLANELLLLQFMDGGSMETNMKRVMKKQAKRAAKAQGNTELAVADVHRDGNGGVWLDQAEEAEYRPLLADDEEQPEAAPTDGFDDSFMPAV